MRSINPTLALGFAGLIFGMGACSDPVTLRDGSVPIEPLQLMDLIVRNGTGGPIDVTLVRDGTATYLGNVPEGRELRYRVDVRALGGGGVGWLVATDAGPFVLRSDPIWIAAGSTLDFTVTSGGIVWKRAAEGARCGSGQDECRH